MRHLLTAAVLAVFAANAFAQDRITLKNGDVLTGKIVTMEEGKVTIASPVLGEMKVAITDIEDLVTADRVKLETKAGDLVEYRILGIENESLRARLETKEVDVNVPLDPETFLLEIPADAARLRPADIDGESVFVVGREPR